MNQRHHQRQFQVSDCRRVTFYAAVFGEVARISEPSTNGKTQSYNEVIKPGAFAALGIADEVIATIDHDPALEFANRSDGTLLLQEDPHGLFASAWIPEGRYGDAILADIESGRLDGCSFRFHPVHSTVSNGVVERRQVILTEVCLTGSPAYVGTSVHLRGQRPGQRTRYLLAKLKLLKLKTKGKAIWAY